MIKSHVVHFYRDLPVGIEPTTNRLRSACSVQLIEGGADYREQSCTRARQAPTPAKFISEAKTAVGYESTQLRVLEFGFTPLRPLVQLGFKHGIRFKLCVKPALYKRRKEIMTLAGLEPAIFGSEDQRLIH